MNQYTNYDVNMAMVMDTQKAYSSKAAQIAYDEAKELYRQKVTENKKKQIDEVILKMDGKLEIFTKNLNIEATPRYVCNFLYPKLTRLYTAGENNILYALDVIVSRQEKRILLDNMKVGDPHYLLKKLNANGCEIYAASRRLQKDYVIKIWAILVNACESDCEVPSNYGWQMLESGKWIFVDENSMIWEVLKKCAQ